MIDKILFNLFGIFILNGNFRLGNNFLITKRRNISIIKAPQQYIYRKRDAVEIIVYVPFLTIGGIGSWVIYVGAGSRNILAAIDETIVVIPKKIYKYAKKYFLKSKNFINKCYYKLIKYERGNLWNQNKMFDNFRITGRINLWKKFL